jgi:uncharacterized protein YecE (DUF72 family)
MSQVLVGTSGYGYVEWVGPVYPEGTKPDDFLRLYAQLFPAVELNFSYYRMPTAGQLSKLLEQAGPGLNFSIKANETLTHKIDPSCWRDSAKTFRLALEPLRKAERLGAVLLQFPYAFHYEVDRRRYLSDILAELADLPLAVEFRNAEWYNNRVIDSFKERKVSLVSLDLPNLQGLPPVMDVVTAPLAYVRFHGRNGETWWGSDSASRYDYLYSEQELEIWADRVKTIAAHADKVLVFFNNHRRGQAVKNAKTFGGMLSRIGLGA